MKCLNFKLYWNYFKILRIRIHSTHQIFAFQFIKVAKLERWRCMKVWSNITLQLSVSTILKILSKDRDNRKVENNGLSSCCLCTHSYQCESYQQNSCLHLILWLSYLARYAWFFWYTGWGNAVIIHKICTLIGLRRPIANQDQDKRMHQARSNNTNSLTMWQYACKVRIMCRLLKTASLRYDYNFFYE